MDFGRSWLTRREFGLALGASALAPLVAEETAGMPWRGPAIVNKVYVAVWKPTWPRPTIDVEQSHKELEAQFAGLEKRHPGVVRFTGGAIVRTQEEVAAWQKSLGEVDGIVASTLTSGTDALLRPIGKLNLPTVLFLRPYTGFQYATFAPFVQAGNRADILASSEFGDLDVYARIFNTIHHVRKSKLIVAASKQDGYARFAEPFQKKFGTTMQFMDYKELMAAADAIDTAQAATLGDEYMRGALRVVEPSRQEIRDAYRFYLGVKELLKREKANGIAIDCLGGFRRGDLNLYPCVAFSKLNDEGLYGVCQSDLQSAMTMLLLTSFSGKPGFIVNPVFDTSRSEVILAHCVAPATPHGIGTAACPYILRSHMEDDKGVAVQVLMPVGGTVTVAKFQDQDTLRFSTAEVLGNVDRPEGCRTQIRTRVADARKMSLNFTDLGVHRVVFYGDYREPLDRMAHMMGFKLLQEC